MCVQIHTVCELTHGVQNYTVVPFAYNMKKFPSLKLFYTHAVTGVTDKYEVWPEERYKIPYSKFLNGLRHCAVFAGFLVFAVFVLQIVVLGVLLCSTGRNQCPVAVLSTR